MDNPPCSCNPNHGQDPRKPFTCADKPDPFSQEELEIFAKFHSLKEEAKKVKSRLVEIEKKIKSNPARSIPTQALLEEKETYEKQLQNLRGEWDQWKHKSEDAAQRRMIALGHISPDPKEDLNRESPAPDTPHEGR